MGNWTHPWHPRLAALALAVALGFGGGCAGTLKRGAVALAKPAYHYFSTPDPEDAWSRKIQGWQERERGDAPSEEDEAVSAAELRAKYEQFRVERRRNMARDLAAWIQSEATQHYIDDGPVDHWATTEETLSSNGDDCDGLELLVFNLLRELGFGSDEVFRAVVYRKSDGQHHMVTLWFEDPDDPWIIDPTGAMTSGMPRMSEVPTWVPIKIFSADRDFTVRPRTVARR